MKVTTETDLLNIAAADLGDEINLIHLEWQSPISDRIAEMEADLLEAQTGIIDCQAEHTESVELYLAGKAKISTVDGEFARIMKLNNHVDVINDGIRIKEEELKNANKRGKELSQFIMKARIVDQDRRAIAIREIRGEKPMLGVPASEEANMRSMNSGAQKLIVIYGERIQKFVDQVMHSAMNPQLLSSAPKSNDSMEELH